MPDDKSISELTTAPDITADTLVEVATPDISSDTGYSSYKGILSTIFDKILNTFSFTQRLNTTNKTVFGAINELEAGGGGGGGSSTLAGLTDVDITTPTDGQVLSYDSVNQEWVNADVGDASKVELTQAEYDALEQAGQIDPTVLYFITDGQSGNEIIDDTTTSASKVWSSNKVSSELATKQNDLTGGSLSNVDLDDYTSNGNYWVTQTNVLNKPVTNFGYLEVLHCSSSIYMQMFTAFGADNTTVKGETYVRFYANSQWYGWNKIADSTPETVKVTRTNITQNAGVSRFGFAAPAVTGYTRMVISANPSNSLIRLVRFEENGNNVDLFLNNDSTSSVTYDITIAVAYIKS